MKYFPVSSHVVRDEMHPRTMSASFHHSYQSFMGRRRMQRRKSKLAGLFFHTTNRLWCYFLSTDQSSVASTTLQCYQCYSPLVLYLKAGDHEILFSSSQTALWSWKGVETSHAPSAAETLGPLRD